MSKSSEIWKSIKDFEEYYEVSNFGRIKSLARIIITGKGFRRIIKEKILSPGHYKKGYEFVCLCNSEEKIKKQLSIHRIVAMEFIQNPENKPQVNHIDGNILNNCVSNLEWNTNSENNRHAYRILGRKSAKGMQGYIGVKNVKSKKIYQFTLNGEFIKSYESGRQAALITGFKQGGIASAARGRYQKSHGYRWSYTDKPNPL